MRFTVLATPPDAASTVWVAPKRLAALSLDLARSTAMMGEAPASAAPWMLLRPTPPVPITTTLLALTPAVLMTAPMPVMTAQPMREAEAKGTSLGMATAWEPSTTTYSAKAPVPRPWVMGAPLREESG